jgi:hypothetical protein
MYEDYKLYGPYLNKKDNRLRVVLAHKETKHKITVSYPKYLMEQHLNRYLTTDETIDHIDGNPLNNNINNLQVIDRKLHNYNDAIRNQDVIVNCAYCGKEFTIEGSKISQRNRKDRYQSGYFCSKICSGKYGKEIQMNIRDHIKVPRVEPVKYKVKSALVGNSKVEVR